MIRFGMESDQYQRADKRRLIVGIAIAVIILVVSVAVTIGLVCGQKQEATNEIVEVPVFLSVTSFGTSNGITRFAVSYRSGTQCQAERKWNYEGTFHMNREVLKPETDEQGVTTVHIHDDLSRIAYAHLVLHCRHVNARLEFGVPFLYTPGTQVLANQTDTIPFRIVNTSLDTSTGELSVIVNISNDMDIGYYFTGLNTSTTPAVAVKYYQYDLQHDTGRYNTTATTEGDTKQYRIVIDRELVDAGGMFMINGITDVSTNYVMDIEVGMGIPIISPVTGLIVPRNHFGFYHFHSVITMDIYDDVYHPWCHMMGNPLPSVETYIRGRDNKTIRIESNDIQVDEYTHVVVAFVTKEAYPDGGTFICSTKPGYDDFEIEFRFLDYVASRIDTDDSGVIEQTPERDVIRCSARGKPLPAVEILLYDRHGPNLVFTGLFQVSRSTTDDYKTSVALTVSPPNKDIHTVCCYVYQPGKHYYSNTLSLTLYPGRPDNTTLENMMLEATWAKPIADVDMSMIDA